MVIVQATTVSTVDKLYILWALCLVAHYEEKGRTKSRWHVKEEFGEETMETWSLYCDIAEEMKYLDQSKMKLTATGRKAVDNWSRIADKLYSAT